MRLRNKKGAQDIISKSEYYIDNPIEHKGKFNKLFKNKHNIEIEIGRYDGCYLSDVME